MQRLPIALLALTVTCAGAEAAAKFPSWDMEKFCTDRAKPTGLVDCIQLQNEARDTVRASWSTYADDDKAECVDYVLADDIPPSYMRLRDCLSLAAKRRQ